VSQGCKVLPSVLEPAPEPDPLLFDIEASQSHSRASSSPSLRGASTPKDLSGASTAADSPSLPSPPPMLWPSASLPSVQASNLLADVSFVTGPGLGGPLLLAPAAGSSALPSLEQVQLNDKALRQYVEQLESRAGSKTTNKRGHSKSELFGPLPGAEATQYRSSSSQVRDLELEPRREGEAFRQRDHSQAGQRGLSVDSSGEQVEPRRSQSRNPPLRKDEEARLQLESPLLFSRATEQEPESLDQEAMQAAEGHVWCWRGNAGERRGMSAEPPGVDRTVTSLPSLKGGRRSLREARVEKRVSEALEVDDCDSSECLD